eukprot:g1508.t1
MPNLTAPQGLQLPGMIGFHQGQSPLFASAAAAVNTPSAASTSSSQQRGGAGAGSTATGVLYGQPQTQTSQVAQGQHQQQQYASYPQMQLNALSSSQRGPRFKYGPAAPVASGPVMRQSHSSRINPAASGVYSLTATTAGKTQMKCTDFDRKHPPVAPQQTLEQKSKTEAALAAMKREGPLSKLLKGGGGGSSGKTGIPGGQKAAIGLLGNTGKLVVRGPKQLLDEMKRNATLKQLAEKDALLWCEEGAAPSETLVAFDFDKTLVKNFLWADLGGLKGASLQKSNLMTWVRDGRLKEVAFGGEDRIQAIRGAIEARLARGDFVCILSSGFAAVIREAIKHMGLGDVLPMVGPVGCRWPYGINKSSRIAKLKDTHRRTQGILIDDDQNYCRQAVRDGHHAIWVREGQGVGDREIQKLLNDDWDVSF